MWVEVEGRPLRGRAASAGPPPRLTGCRSEPPTCEPGSPRDRSAPVAFTLQECSCREAGSPFCLEFPGPSGTLGSPARAAVTAHLCLRRLGARSRITDPENSPGAAVAPGPVGAAVGCVPGARLRGSGQLRNVHLPDPSGRPRGRPVSGCCRNAQREHRDGSCKRGAQSAAPPGGFRGDAWPVPGRPCVTRTVTAQ